MKRLTFPYLVYVNSCDKNLSCISNLLPFLSHDLTDSSLLKGLRILWFIILWQRKQKYNFHRSFPLKSSSIPFPSSTVSCSNYWEFVLLEFHWCIQTVSIKPASQSLLRSSSQSPATSPFWHHGFRFCFMSVCPMGSANIHCTHSGSPWHNGNLQSQWAQIQSSSLNNL